MTSLTIKDIARLQDFPEGKCWIRRACKGNETVIREGDADDNLFVVEKGCLRVTGSVELEDRRCIQPGICDLGPGDLFGELCLFDDQPRSASVVAVTDSELLQISGERLRAWMDAHPETGYRLIKELFEIQIRRLRLANRRVENLLAWGLKAHGIDEHL